MNTYLSYIESLLISGNFTEDDYNRLIVTGVEQGYIRDVSKNMSKPLDRFQVVSAAIEFPNGHQFSIDIYNPPDLLNSDKRYNFKVQVKQLLLKV